MSSNENRPSATHDDGGAGTQKHREFPAYKFDEPSDGRTTFTYWCTESPEQPTYLHDTASGLLIVTWPDGTASDSVTMPCAIWSSSPTPKPRNSGPS
jgi:hypothetical protein